MPGVNLDSMSDLRKQFSTVAQSARGRALAALDAFFAAASAGLTLLDEQLRCVRVNQALAAISGKSVAEHLGRKLSDVLPEAAGALEPTLKRVRNTGAAIERLPFELGERSLIGSFFPVYDEHGDVNGVGGIIMDITERTRLEDELRAAVEMRERVLAVVSHDLRNPLGSIALAVATLDAKSLEDPAVARRIDIVRRAARTMEMLIDDLLDTASIHAGKLALEISDESAARLIEEAFETHAPLAAERGITLIDESLFGSMRVHCDRDRILQVFGNLCGNAMKFCRPGDRIALRGRIVDHCVVFEVEDTGPGIPPDDVPHLFEPYWSTARGRERGTGLGLFICTAIVEAHGGRISVASTLGKGTTFSIHLPPRG